MGVRTGMAASSSSSMDDNKVSISDDQAALYDRQIRLWGLDGQKRLMDADVLIVGMNGLATEIIKNICLSGVQSICIVDGKQVQESDFTTNFFIAGTESGPKTRGEAAKNAIQDLNPNVKVKIDNDHILNKDHSFFSSFAAVFVTDVPLSELLRISTICHTEKVLFFCGTTWGLHGYCFIDLQRHSYKVQQDSVQKVKERRYDSLEETFAGLEIGRGLTKKTSRMFYLFAALYNFFEKHKRIHTPDDFSELKDIFKSTLDLYKTSPDVPYYDLLKSSFGELSPVCAVMGGLIANEMIKGLTASQYAIHNFIFFDGNECAATVESIGKVSFQTPRDPRYRIEETIIV